jgi:hypothetical protein
MQERKPAATPQIARMQEEQEKFRTKADAEKRKLLELERQSEELEAKLVQRRKKLGGPNAPRDNAAQVYPITSRLLGSRGHRTTLQVTFVSWG